MKLFIRADGDSVTPTVWPFKEDEDSLLSEFWVGCLLDFKKRWGMKMSKKAWFYCAVMPLAVLMNPVRRTGCTGGPVGSSPGIG